jgi:hypothetical protein
MQNEKNMPEITALKLNSGVDASKPQYARPEYARDNHPAISKKPGKKRQYSIKAARGYSQSTTSRGDEDFTGQKQGSRMTQRQHQPQVMAGGVEKSFNR